MYRGTGQGPVTGSMGRSSQRCQGQLEMKAKVQERGQEGTRGA